MTSNRAQALIGALLPGRAGKPVKDRGQVAGPASDWTPQLRRGVLELCILKLLRGAPSYGYEIVTTLESLGPLAAGENTVYPLLRRLKADGHLETFTRESPAGPPRQYYRITAVGKRRLAALDGEWDDMVQAVEKCRSIGDAS